METLARAVGKWLVASKGELDRVTYASMRVNPNELFTAGDGHGNGDDDVCRGHDPDPGHDPGDDQGNGEFDSSKRHFVLRFFLLKTFFFGKKLS